MSHYCMTLVIRTTQPGLAQLVDADLSAVVSAAMAPYNEDSEDRKNTFWDWWVIGGRYSGEVLTSRLGTERLEQFNAVLNSRKVMVKGLVCGKEELADSQTEEMVDALWRDMFPDSGLAKCPLFKHGSPSQYDKRGELPFDVCKVEDVPASHAQFSIALIELDYEKKPSITQLLHREIWNGSTHQDTAWDGTFATALEHFNKRMGRCREPATVMPQDTVVTVDYHS